MANDVQNVLIGHSCIFLLFTYLFIFILDSVPGRVEGQREKGERENPKQRVLSSTLGVEPDSGLDLTILRS